MTWPAVGTQPEPVTCFPAPKLSVPRAPRHLDEFVSAERGVLQVVRPCGPRPRGSRLLSRASRHLPSVTSSPRVPLLRLKRPHLCSLSRSWRDGVRGRGRRSGSPCAVAPGRPRASPAPEGGGSRAGSTRCRPRSAADGFAGSFPRRCPRRHQQPPAGARRAGELPRRDVCGRVTGFAPSVLRHFPRRLSQRRSQKPLGVGVRRAGAAAGRFSPRAGNPAPWPCPRPLSRAWALRAGAGVHVLVPHARRTPSWAGLCWQCGHRLASTWSAQQGLRYCYG